MSEGLIIKEGIAVYYPEDPLERAIQDASHKYMDRWLSSFQCQLFAKAVSSLKIFDPSWLEEEELFTSRMEYFFNPLMASRQETMVFLTHNIYLRDILENREINAFLHDPVSFVTRPLAHYLFREYPVHIFVDKSYLGSDNKDITLFSLGGLIISEEDVILSPEAIIDIKTVSNKDNQFVVDEEKVQRMQQLTGVKAASVQKERGVFYLDEDERAIEVGSPVWDKDLRCVGTVEMISPGEGGHIIVKYENGNSQSFDQYSFDQKFIVS